MNFGAYAPYLEPLYNDRMEIYRSVDKFDDDGAIFQELPDIPLYSDIPCLMTTKQPDSPEGNNPAYNQYDVIGAVYCKNTWDIQKGDVIKVQRMDGGVKYAEFSGIASYPSINALCQKTLLLDKRKEVASGQQRF